MVLHSQFNTLSTLASFFIITHKCNAIALVENLIYDKTSSSHVFHVSSLAKCPLAVLGRAYDLFLLLFKVSTSNICNYSRM